MRRALLVATTALTGALALGCGEQQSPTAPMEQAATEGGPVALASARKPVHSSFVETFSVTLPCGSFTGLSEGTLTEHATTFFNKAGEPFRLVFHIRYRASITNLASGKTLPDNARYNGTLDLLTGAVEVNGRVYNVKDRENGIRIKDIGRIVFDGNGNITFVAGRHDADAFGDATAQYCAALA